MTLERFSANKINQTELPDQMSIFFLMQAKQETKQFLTVSKMGGAVLRPVTCLAENLHPNSQQAENKREKTIKSLHCDPSALPGVKKTRVQTEIKWTAGHRSNMLLLTIASQTVCLEASVSEEDGALPWHVPNRLWAEKFPSKPSESIH